MHNYKILKKSGETELFDISKLRNSLLRSGASRDCTDKVLKELKFIFLMVCQHIKFIEKHTVFWVKYP